jgi:hypothetical protein
MMRPRRVDLLVDFRGGFSSLEPSYSDGSERIVAHVLGSTLAEICILAERDIQIEAGADSLAIAHEAKGDKRDVLILARL